MCCVSAITCAFFPATAFNPDEMIQYAVQGTAFLVGLGAKLILIASHTLSCFAGNAISAESAGVPVLDIITASVNRAVLESRHKRIGIIGSRAVIESRRYPEKIREQRPEAGIYSAACPLLIPLIEEEWLKKPVTAMIVKKYLIPLKTRQVDTLILASTPYSLLSARDTAKNRQTGSGDRRGRCAGGNCVWHIWMHIRMLRRKYSKPAGCG